MESSEPQDEDDILRKFNKRLKAFADNISDETKEGILELIRNGEVPKNKRGTDSLLQLLLHYMFNFKIQNIPTTQIEEIIVALINSGRGDIGWVNGNKDTALMDACRYPLPEMAMLLMETFECNPMAVNKQGYTAYYFATENELEDVKRRLAEIHADFITPTLTEWEDEYVNQDTDEERKQEILDMVSIGYFRMESETPDHLLRMIKMLNKKDRDLVDKGLDLAFCLAFIESGRGGNGRRNSSGVTPLLYACANKMTEVALALLSRNDASPHKALNGYTAYQFAVQNGMHEVADKLETFDVNTFGIIRTSPLLYEMHRPRSERDVEKIMGMIEEGTDTMFIDEDGKTALYIAIDEDMREVALAILATGRANQGVIPEIDGPTALMLACAKGDIEIAMRILETGESNWRYYFDETKPSYKVSYSALSIAKKKNMQDVVNAIEALKSIPVKIDISTEGFSVAEGEYVSINEFMQNEYHLCIEFNGKCYLVRLEDILRQFHYKGRVRNVAPPGASEPIWEVDPCYYKYRCIRTGDTNYNEKGKRISFNYANKDINAASIPDRGENGADPFYPDDPEHDEHERYVRLRNEGSIPSILYYSLTSIIGLPVLVIFTTLEKWVGRLLEGRGHRYVKLMKMGFQIPGIISKYYRQGDISADHCQPGPPIDVYDIVPAEPVNMNLKRKQLGLDEGLEKEDLEEEEEEEQQAKRQVVPVVNVRVGEVNYKFDMSEIRDKTVGELKGLLLRQLGPEYAGDITNVRFIYGGKVLKNEEQVNNLSNNYPITIQALIPKGGTKTIRRKHNKAKRTKKVIRRKNITRKRRCKKTQRVYK